MPSPTICPWIFDKAKARKRLLPGFEYQELLLPVVPDVLHIVIIFHGVDELLHQNCLLIRKGLVVLGDHLDLGGDEGVKMPPLQENGGYGSPSVGVYLLMFVTTKPSIKIITHPQTECKC